MKIPEAVNHINVQNNIDLVDGKINPNKRYKSITKKHIMRNKLILFWHK
ncbi:OspC3, probably secreted by the Mxi-Spa machinery [Shigella boydii]|nr:OspC3, probably secreted by the Mxi-Spa machinery [Shigella boydii]